MKLETEQLVGQIRQADPEGWGLMEDLLDRMPAWVAEADRVGDIPDGFWSGAPIGLLNRMNMPVEYGGVPLTATALRRSVIFERVGRICPALPMGMPGPGLSMPPVLSLGTETQKRAYFGRFCDAERPVWGAFAITEPQSGSDATAMRTVAVARDDGYELSGQKCFITSGKRADVVVVFATIAPDKGRFGIRAFVVPCNTPGFTIDRCEDMMGLRASQLASLSFDGCRLPTDSMLGHNGRRGPLIDAFTGAQSAWDYMRPALASGINGVCAGMIEHAERLLALDEDGFTIAQVEACRQQLAEFRARVQSSQLMALRAAWKYDSGARASLDASMSKAYSSMLVMELAHVLCSMFPMRAVRLGDPLEKFYRDAKAFDILEGTGDMQRLMVARAYETSTH